MFLVTLTEMKTMKNFNWFRNKIGPGVLHDFIGYFLDEEERVILKGTVNIIPRADSWIFIFPKLLPLKGYREGCCQKLFHIMFSKYVNWLRNSLFGK